MKTLLCHVTSVVRVLGVFIAILAATMALDSTATGTSSQRAQPPGRTEIAGQLLSFPDYRSWCTQVLSHPSVVYPDDLVTVTAKALVGGACGGAKVWMSCAVSAELDGEEATDWNMPGIYDFCYDGTPQPVVWGGCGVTLPDDGVHTITFSIDPNILYPIIPTEVANGAQCYSNTNNTKNICGPAVVMCSDSGGTHGWSTVQFFELWTDDNEENTVNDYDGDRKADPSRYEKATGTWKIKFSKSGYQEAVLSNMLGGPDQTSAVADYDNDKKADPAVYNETTGDWIIELSGSGYVQATLPGVLGGPTFMPVPGDYDGDKFGDLAVYQESSGLWQFRLSSCGYALGDLENFGGTGYVPVSGDYDGDGKMDPALYEAGTRTWLLRCSASDYVELECPNILGGAGWVPVVGDYDGDHRADPAVRKSSTGEWQILFSGNNYALASAILDF